jgi:predicted nucleic acid-binding protein
MPFVLDASVALSWCFPEETSTYSDEILRRLGRDQALVPALWPFEIANVMLVGERRGRLTMNQAELFAHYLQTLPILLDEVDSARVLGTIRVLGRAHRLSSYDAAYLELALRQMVSLATQDTRLVAAANEAGVARLP